MSHLKDNILLRTFAGERTEEIPLWEVWFLRQGGLCRQLLGSQVTTPPEEIALAKRLGMPCIRVGGIEDGLPRAYRDAGGVERYSPEGALISLDQLEEIPPLNVDALRPKMSAYVDAAHAEGLAAIAYVPWCFHSTATAMGLLNFAYKTVDNIDFVHSIMEFVEERNRVAIRKLLIPLGIDVVLFDGDCAYRNGLMVSPPVFRELTQERTAKTVSQFREAGIPYVFHTDGQLDHVIPMLVELGFTAVHGVEAMANDLGDIKRRFGDQIVLMGNMDITFLGYSGVDEVREATRKMLDIGSQGGGYVAACNTSPEDFIPLENYLAFVDEIHAYRAGN